MMRARGLMLGGACFVTLAGFTVAASAAAAPQHSRGRPTAAHRIASDGATVTGAAASSPVTPGTLRARIATSAFVQASGANGQVARLSRSGPQIPTQSVAGVSPNAGASGSGGEQKVIITGSGFTGAAGVSFGSIDVTSTAYPCPSSPAGCFEEVNDAEIDADTPVQTAGTVEVVVDGGAANPPQDNYSYFDPPTVTSVNSPQQEGATGVPVTGSNFSYPAVTPFASGVSEVDLVPTGGGLTVAITNACGGGSPPKCFSVTDDGDLTIDLPSSMAAGQYDTEVLTPGGTSNTSSSDLLVVLAAPTLTGLNPSTGSTLGGNSVVLTGTDFNTATDVNFGASDLKACPSSPCFTIDSNTQITVNGVAAHAAGPVSVDVITTGGTTGNQTYTYVTPPTLTSLNPSTGSTLGGNGVVLTGTDFNTATDVNFGASDLKACPSSPCFTIDSNTQITVSGVPAHAAGPVSVDVVTAGGTTGTQNYTYAALPTVTAVSPPAGPAGVAANSVTLTGTAFEVPGTFTASDVFFGALDITLSPCPGTPTGPCFTVVSATQITVEDVPGQGAGTVDITVKTPLGTSAVAPPGDTFAWAPVPTVTNVSPNAGATSGGTTVVLTGTGFESGSNFSTTAVMIGSTPCAITSCYVVNSATQITIAGTPPGAAGMPEITVTTVGGTSALNPPHDVFTYVAAFPTVTSVSPSSGSLSGGAILTVTGSNFGTQSAGFHATKVSFGSTNVTTTPCPSNPTNACFNVLQDSTIRVFTPSATGPGPVDVQVTNPSSSSPSTPVPGDRYTYVAPSVYTPLAVPFRICDTRSGQTHVGCTSGRALGTNGTVVVQITGIVVGGESVPAGAEAVVVNLTAIDHSASASFVTAYPTTRPTASNINIDGGKVQANLAVVALSSTGTITVFNAIGSVDIVVDVEGYFAAPAGNVGTFHPLSPVRVCDTRQPPAKTNCITGALAGGTWRKVVVSGVPPGGTGVGIPADATAAAAVFNLTAVSPSAATFLAISPPNSSDVCPTGHAGASNLNPSAGETEANRVFSNLGPHQDVCVYNSVGSVNFLIDVNGWFSGAGATPGADFYAVPPTRICDTRSRSGTQCTLTPTATSIRLIPVAGIKVTPAIGGAAAPVAIIGNLTGISGTAGTFLELYPAGPNRPQSASDLNAAAHDVIANLDVVALATSTTGVNIDGNIDLFNSVGSINIVIDVAGWFQ